MSTKTYNGLVRVQRIATGIYAVRVGSYFLDITATDKLRCDRIAKNLRKEIVDWTSSRKATDRPTPTPAK